MQARDGGGLVPEQTHRGMGSQHTPQQGLSPDIPATLRSYSRTVFSDSLSLGSPLLTDPSVLSAHIIAFPISFLVMSLILSSCWWCCRRSILGKRAHGNADERPTRSQVQMATNNTRICLLECSVGK